MVPEGEPERKRLSVSASGRLTFFVQPLPEPSPPMRERIRIGALTVVAALAMLFSIAVIVEFFCECLFPSFTEESSMSEVPRAYDPTDHTLPEKELPGEIVEEVAAHRSPIVFGVPDGHGRELTEDELLQVYPGIDPDALPKP